MKVSFKLISTIKTDYHFINNVSWIRLTENVICIECHDYRTFRYNLKHICELEIKDV